MNIHKIISLSILLFSFATFSQEDCSYFDYSPVMGKDGRCYMNECFLLKSGTKVRKNSQWKSSDYVSTDTMTWYIYPVCTPIRQMKVVSTMPDGSLIYESFEGDSLFRGKRNTCRCLSKGTMISSEDGEIAIQKIKLGDMVWTIDDGKKVLRPVIKTLKSRTEKKYKMVYLHLADGRTIRVSVNHPTSDYQDGFGDLEINNNYDGSKIASISIVPYKKKWTYDILPKSSTGIYWANGIKMGSTLYEPEIDIEPPSVESMLKKDRWLQKTTGALNEDGISYAFFGMSYYMINLSKEYPQFNILPANEFFEDPSCLTAIGYDFVYGKRDTLILNYSYVPYCNYGWDPAGPDDPGRPGPVLIDAKFLVLNVTDAKLDLIYVLEDSLGDTLHFISPEAVEKEKSQIKSEMLSKLDAISSEELQMKDGKYYFFGELYTGKVVEFYPSNFPTIQIWRVFELKDGLRHGEYVEYALEGYKSNEGEFENGSRVGTWTWYDNLGNPDKVREY